jgi:hypothetical protein
MPFAIHEEWLIDQVGGFKALSEYVHPKHPPNKKDRHDGTRDVNNPISKGFRFRKIEHAAIVAGPHRIAGDKSPYHSFRAAQPIDRGR